MGIQIVVKANSENEINLILGDIAPQCEVFPIEAGCFGLSIPTNVIDSVGEKSIESKLELLSRFDLWSGEWSDKKTKKWLFW